MAISGLSLPVDIPWKRLCASEDMIDTKLCDREFPLRWRSSIAVFSYEPPEEHQTHEGMIISYLKVACTITGYQPDGDEVGIRDRMINTRWCDEEITKNFEEEVTKYYGCYGAILEVGVAPLPAIAADVPLARYPYFADFQPKKRELYESVSETGESLSRSLDEVSVGKGKTTTTNDEFHDMNLGGGGSYGASYMGIGAEQAGNVNMQKGTRSMTSRELTDVRTTNRAQEVRESFSHTTQLTQMYHQLTSYHLGTNRAVFFMLPRPHIVQSPKTFVNGPRLLEGIQEFFLVVMRPDDIGEICVEAYVETAHLASEPIEYYDTTEKTYQFVIDTNDLGKIGDKKKWQEQWMQEEATYYAPEGWEIDVDRGEEGGYTWGIPHCAMKLEGDPGKRRIAERYSYNGRVSGDRDYVQVGGRLRREFDTWGRDSKDWKVNYILTVNITIYLRKKESEIRGYQNTLFLTGRKACCCPELLAFPLGQPGTWITGEYDFPKPVGQEMLAKGPGEEEESPVGYTLLAKGPAVQEEGEPSMPIITANQIQKQVGHTLYRHMNHPRRYPWGSVTFLDTKFLGRRIAKLMQGAEHPDNKTLDEIEGLDPDIRKKVEKVYPEERRRWFLKADLKEIKDRAGLTTEEAASLRRAALGLKGKPAEPKDRWDPPPKKAKTSTVPDVIGLSFDRAQEVLREAGFEVSAHEYADSEKPADTVLSQKPGPEEEANSPPEVDLLLATGAIVQIPDIVGLPLSEAICALREAGLESEPEIVITQNVEMPKGHVVDVKPEMRSFVTPHASVFMNVAKESPEQSGGKK